MAHLANGTATHQLTSRPKLFGTALLAARLHHTAVLAAGIHHRPPLGNGQGKGLFAVHILARLASVHRLQRAYNEKRVHYLFRFFWDYSGGQQTNFGAHHLDIAQWGLDMDNSGPVSAEAKARFNKDGWFEVPEWTEINYRYANGITMVCGQGQPSGTTSQIFAKPDKTKDCPNSVSFNHMATDQEF